MTLEQKIEFAQKTRAHFSIAATGLRAGFRALSDTGAPITAPLVTQMVRLVAEVEGVIFAIDLVLAALGVK